MRKIDAATKEEIAKMLQEILEPLIKKTVDETVKNVVAAQVRDWHDMFVKCSDVAYSADNKITAIWFYLKHPKGFLFRVDKQEGRPFQDGKWTFTKRLVCYLDYLYRGEIHTVTLIQAYDSDIGRYYSAQVYEETENVLRVLITTKSEDGSIEKARREVEKSTGNISCINDPEKEIKIYGNADEKETKVFFQDKR